MPWLSFFAVISPGRPSRDSGIKFNIFHADTRRICLIKKEI